MAGLKWRIGIASVLAFTLGGHASSCYSDMDAHNYLIEKAVCANQAPPFLRAMLPDHGGADQLVTIQGGDLSLGISTNYEAWCLWYKKPLMRKKDETPDQYAYAKTRAMVYIDDGQGHLISPLDSLNYNRLLSASHVQCRVPEKPRGLNKRSEVEVGIWIYRTNMENENPRHPNCFSRTLLEDPELLPESSRWYKKGILTFIYTDN